MKSSMFIPLLLSFICLLSSCSLPFKLPSDGIWYNEDLDVALEFKTVKDSSYPKIINVIWNGSKNVLGVHIGYGKDIILYIIDENGNEKNLLTGNFKYSSDEFIVIPSRIAEPFDASGELTDVTGIKFSFTKQSDISESA